MKKLVTIGFRFTFCLLALSLWQCSSAQRLEKQAPVAIEEVYYQSWVSGVKGGGSGVNIFVVLEHELPKKITLDSIYFQTLQLKLKQDSYNAKLFVGRFLKDTNQPETILGATDKETSNGNVVNRFTLKADECVIVYNQYGVTKYFKLEGVTKKATPVIPSVKPH